MFDFIRAVIFTVSFLPASAYWRSWVMIYFSTDTAFKMCSILQQSQFCGHFSAVTISQGIKWVLEDSPGGTNDVTVVFFDRPHPPKKALLLLNINVVKKQLSVRNYAVAGPEVLDKNFSLPKDFSEIEILHGQETTLTFWFPQDDLIIFVRESKLNF